MPLAQIMCQTPPKSETLAEVNGATITKEEVDKAVGMQIAGLEEQIYRIRQQKLEALIRDRLLAAEAKKRDMTVQALLDSEVNSKVAQVTDQEVQNFYQANKAQIRGEESALREQIRSYLHNQKLAARQEAFLKPLREDAKVEIFLKPPPVYRVEVSVEGAPSRGPEKAPVTIIEISDYHCPYCKTVQRTLEQIRTEYGDRVRFVFRDFPIDSLHPGARKAAEAARCADDQGKFWEYHEKLFAGGSDASPQNLTTLAKEVGLDLSVFEECFKSGKHQTTVQKDVDLGVSLGVTGTPAFFINGRMLSGAQPKESFVKVIEEELARLR